MPVQTQQPEIAPAQALSTPDDSKVSDDSKVMDAPTESAARAACRGTTLVETLRLRAAESPEATHLILPQDGAEDEILTFANLLDEAKAIAAGLRARGVEKGQTVALMLPTGKTSSSALPGSWLLAPFRFRSILGAGGSAGGVRTAPGHDPAQRSGRGADHRAANDFPRPATRPQSQEPRDHRHRDESCRRRTRSGSRRHRPRYRRGRQ